MKRNEHKRLKTIGWLMLACLLLLVVFSASWLKAQYREEEKRLYTDLEMVFNKTRDSILNAALDKQISVILHDSNIVANGKRIKFQMSVSKTATSSFATPPPDLHGMAAGNVRQITIVNKTIPSSAADTHFVDRALRTAFTRTLESKDQLYEGFLSAVDSTQLENAFREAVSRVNKRFSIFRIRDSIPGSIFVFATPETSTAPLGIEGYQPFLFKQLVPQIGFSLFLLLLSSLTFLLAYRNMIRQHRFGKQKDNFISNISHELKTPVATTKVALEALSNYNALDDPRRSKQYLHIANAEMERLEQLVNRVLNTIQTEHGILQLHKVPIDLVLLVKDITDTLSPAMEEKGVTSSINTKETHVILLADKIHMRGALYNLIDNAIKYGGNVLQVHIVSFENQVKIQVRDNGEGIAAIYQESVFEKFFRIPQGNKHDVKGHGLGLSYARYVLEAHGGTIRLDSNAGQETTFTVSIPLTDQP